MRWRHSEKVPGRYVVLLEFRQQVTAEQFYLEYNGKSYNSMEVRTSEGLQSAS